MDKQSTAKASNENIEAMSDQEMLRETIALWRNVLLENQTAQKTPQRVISQRTANRIDLLELFYALLGRWKLILLCTILGGVLMMCYTKFFVTPQYRATSKLYVLNLNDQELNSGTMAMGTQLKWDYQELLSVWEVRDRVLQRIGSAGDGGLGGAVSILADEDSRIITVSAISTDPQRAKDIANAYAEVSSEYLAELLSVDRMPIASRARLPERPYNILWKRNLMTGLLIGALIPIVVLTILFVLDDKIKMPDNIQHTIGVSTLTVLPMETGLEKGRKRRRTDG